MLTTYNLVDLNDILKIRPAKYVQTTKTVTKQIVELMIINKEKQNLHYLTSILLIPFFLTSSSCNQASEPSNTTESDLMMKINAVQEQIMAQGNMTEVEERAISSLCSIISKDDGLANYNPEDRMILKDVDIAPVYNGCEERSVEKTRECFDNNIAAFIEREFNLSVSKDLNLQEPKQVEAFFIVNDKGYPSGLKVRNAEVSVQAEILRVLRKIPRMKPAIHNGKSVSVLCSIIVRYGNNVEVENIYIPERPGD